MHLRAVAVGPLWLTQDTSPASGVGWLKPAEGAHFTGVIILDHTMFLLVHEGRKSFYVINLEGVQPPAPSLYVAHAEGVIYAFR